MLKQLTNQGIPCHTNEMMSQHTSFKIGGPAELYLVPQDVNQLKIGLQAAKDIGCPVFLLGSGTNVLFLDEGFPGMVIHLEGLAGEVAVEGQLLHASASAPLKQVCIAAQEASLTGLEFGYGIPGSVGGAVYMDAGAYDGDVAKVLKSVRYLDENLEICERPAEQLELRYRHSIFQKKDWCVLSATFQLEPGNSDQIKNKMEQFMAQREQKQPLDKPSAGSAFKRPPGAFAGALIDQCGLRGFRVGDAAISEKHCGFIVNLGSATAEDVLQLADQVAETVKQKTGYTLEKEVYVVQVKS